jgi:histidine ammonia-lyase
MACGSLLPSCASLGVVAVLGASSLGGQVWAAPEYHPIVPTMEGTAVTLTGHDLTIEQLIAVARYGAKVQYGPGVVQHASDALGLMLEADAEGVPVYGINRGYGVHREDEKKQERSIRPMLGAGALPEVSDEELVRATLLIAANTLVYAAARPEESQMLLDLLNKRITPVAYSRGTLGEADFPAMSNNITATVGGEGEVYYKGVRMAAADALRQAGLKPLTGRARGGAENAYGDALAALVVADARRALEWTDLIFAMAKLGINGSVTPMGTLSQSNRPFKWVNWDAARIMDILKGSYLFESDPKRILQDPQSMDSFYIRAGSAWQAWAALRDNLLLQINSADLNPAAWVGASPQDSWELSTPEYMRFYVKGGALSHGQHGYVLSTSNWDPYPLANDVEAFTNALANMDAQVAQMIERFSDRGPTAFFTAVKPLDVLTTEQFQASPWLPYSYPVVMDLWAEVQSQSRSITPGATAADFGDADTEGLTRLKGTHAREVVDLTMKLLAYDLLTTTYWMDVRKVQNPTRSFGQAPTAAWTAFRNMVPWQQDPKLRPQVPYGIVAYNFLKSTPATTFYPHGPAMPDTEGNSTQAKATRTQ